MGPWRVLPSLKNHRVIVSGARLPPTAQESGSLAMPLAAVILGRASYARDVGNWPRRTAIRHLLQGGAAAASEKHTAGP